MVDNIQRMKEILESKPMTLDDISRELSISHRKAKRILQSIDGVKFVVRDDRKYYSVSAEKLENIRPVKRRSDGGAKNRRPGSLFGRLDRLPFLLDYIPWNRKAVIAYAIIILALSLYLKSGLDAFPIGDERLYAAAGIQAARGKIFIYEHPPVSYFMFGLSTYLMPLDYDIVMQLPQNMYYGISHPAVIEVLRNALPGMRLVPILFSFLLAGVMFYYSRRLYGTRPALLVFFMVSLSINLLLYSTVLMMEIVMLFFGTTTVLFYALDYVPDRTQKKALVLFVLMTLTLGTRSLQPFMLFGIVAVSEALQTVLKRRIDPAMWVALVASVLAFFMYYPFDFFTASINQFTVVSKFGQNMLVPMLSKATLIVLLFAPIAIYKYLTHLTRKRDVRPSFHVLFLAAILLGAYSLYIGQFRYAMIALPFLFMVMPYAFRTSGTALKNIALALAVLALASSFYYFPYFDSFNNPVSRAVGITYTASREAFVNSYSYLEQNYDGESVWTDHSMMLYAEIPMTGFYDYDVAKDINGRVITEGRFHKHCADAGTMRAHVDEMGYDLFIETDPDMVEDRCPGLKELLGETGTVYSDDLATIYEF